MASVRWPMPALPVWLALLCAGAAAPRPGEELTALGFSRDGKLFAMATAAPGEPRGTLRAWDVSAGRPVDRALPSLPLGAGRKALPPAEVLAELDLGADPGVERYRSGTALATDFAAGGTPIHVEVAPRAIGRAPGSATAVVSIRRGRCARRVATGVEGRDFNLVNVLTSRDEGSLAVLFKFTDGGLRRYGAAVARLSDGALDDAGCVEAKAPPRAQASRTGPDRMGPPVPSATCLDKLRSLCGHYTGAERIRDPRGKGEIPLYALAIEVRGGRPTLSLFEAAAPGPVVCGHVTGCQLGGGELLVTTRDEGGACDEALLRILPRPDRALEIEFHGFAETYLHDGARSLGRSVGSRPTGP